MSPLVAYHATRRVCRDSIRAHGLLCWQPTPARPFGVYVFRHDGAFDHPGWNSHTFWQPSRREDLWEVAYIGPMVPDHYVLNGMILLMPACHVTLVTSNRD